LKTFYFRFHEGLGHAVVERTKVIIDDLVKTLTFEDTTFEIKPAEGSDLKEFFSKHGEHYNMCLRFL